VGDEVVIPDAVLGSRTPKWSLICGGDAGVRPRLRRRTTYKLKPEALEAAITPRTKWLIFNSPSNPSGAAYTQAGTPARWQMCCCAHPHVWILTDDMYEHLVFDGFEFMRPSRRSNPASTSARSP